MDTFAQFFAQQVGMIVGEIGRPDCGVVGFTIACVNVKLLYPIRRIVRTNKNARISIRQLTDFYE
jgi:hypothetical protein